MQKTKVAWRDWDWAADVCLGPMPISTPGQIVFCPFDLFRMGDSDAQRLLDNFHAGALLCPRTHFVLCTDNLAGAARYYAGGEVGSPAPMIQAAAARTMLAAASQESELARPWQRDGSRRYTPDECRAWAERYGGGALVAGLTIPHDTPLLPNVWLGARIGGRDAKAHAAALATLATIPVAVRWLYLGNGAECDFAEKVWRTQYEWVGEPGAYGVVETKRTAVRKVDWVVCGGINTAAVEYHLAQAVESGTPAYVEAVDVLPLDCAVRQFPVAAEREPTLTPELARAARARLRQRQDEGTI